MVGGIVLADRSYKWDGTGFALAMISGTVLLFLIVIWPCNYYGNISCIEAFKATQATLEISRYDDIEPLERAALQQKVIEENQWLARVKYWNNTIFDPMYPDAIQELQPLR